MQENIEIWRFEMLVPAGATFRFDRPMQTRVCVSSRSVRVLSTNPTDGVPKDDDSGLSADGLSELRRYGGATDLDVSGDPMVLLPGVHVTATGRNASPIPLIVRFVIVGDVL